MADEKNLGNDLNDMLDDAKDGANEVLASENKKILCGILAIVIGWTGIHKFLLGYTKEGILQIVLSLACGIGAIVALIEGIIYLTKSDEDFYNTYQVGKKGWF